MRQLPISDEERVLLQRLLDADASEEEPWQAHSVDALIDTLGDDAEDAVALVTRRIGDYTLMELLGEGGSSLVFRATRDLDGARQNVALKLIRRSGYSADVRRALRRERRALVALAHPNIARLIDAGVSAEGAPYLVMELVEGATITAHATAHALDTRSRLRLLAVVCRAVATAHRSLIVHRDLKPSNILVTADGTVKLLDFGIAKLLDEEADEATRTGYSPLTPAYAAPEQFSGGVISTATDVYALGVLMRELVFGVTPPRVRSQRLDSGKAPAAVAAVTDADVASPVPATLRQDAANIIAVATAEEPDRRYAGAADLADDIDRLLDGLPVKAHPPSRAYRARKFFARHRAAVVLASLVGLVVLSSLAVALWQAQLAREQARLTAQEARRANNVRGFLEGLFEPISDGVAANRTPSVREMVDIGVQRAQDDQELGAAERTDLLTMFARLYDNLGDGARARALAISANRLAAEKLPATHPASIGALALRGQQALNDENYAAAETDLREALRRSESDAGLNASRVEILDQLSVVEMDRGHTDTALAYEADALAERIRRDGADSRSASSGYNNLGYGLVGAGRFDEAAEAYRHTYDIDRSHLDPQSYIALGSLSNWGWALVQAGHIREAIGKLEAAQQGLDKLEKPRSMHVYNAQKLCLMKLAFAPPEDTAICARSLQLTRAVMGENSMFMAFALRADASRLLETADFDAAAKQLDAAWTKLPDTAENREGRGGVRYVAATLAWLRGDAPLARRYGREAIDLLAGINNLWSARLNAETVLLLACTQMPGAECPADIAGDLTRDIAAVRNADDPRLLLARTALARSDLASAPQAAAQALERAIASARVEMADDHPLIAAARFWRAHALELAGRCTEADTARREARTANRHPEQPWAHEAAAADAKEHHCPKD